MPGLDRIKKQEVINLIPAKTKAPISKTSTERLKVAFQHCRTENKFLKEKIDELQSEIKKNCQWKLVQN